MKNPGPSDKVRATPIERVLELDEEADDPGSLVVRASTDLLFPDREDWIVNPLLSPGTVVPWGGDLDAAFEQEAEILARMIQQIGVRVVLHD